MGREKWFINESEFDDIQYKIRMLSVDFSCVIQGCAGSGKTILALWRAKEVQESMVGSYKFIVYTKALRKFIDDGIREIGVDSENVLYEWEWLHRRQAIGADYMIIDEAQDFTESEICRFQKKANKSIILFGDTAQQLYKSKKIKYKEGTKEEVALPIIEIAAILGHPLRTLNKNYRLPKKIARFAKYLLISSEDLENRCIKEGSTLPMMRKFDSPKKELEYIVNKIRSENLTDAAILVSTNDEAKMVYNFLNEMDMTPEVKYSSKDSSFSFSLDFSTENPKIMTYHSSKGLQFESVFLPFCETKQDSFRIPLYVAMTRASKYLFISHTNNKSVFLSTIPSELYTTEDLILERIDDLPF